MHYYQFNIADYRKDTQHLSPIEHYIYRELMDWLYLDEQPIPKDMHKILRRLRLSNDHSTDVEQVLEEYWTEREDGYVQERVLFEINEYKRRIENASKAGKASAKARKVNDSKGSERPLDNRTATVQPTNNHKPITNNQYKDSVGADAPKRKKFLPPSPSDVAGYLAEKGNTTIDPVHFVDFYEARGWKLSSGTKMANWKAAVRTWIGREKTDGTNRPARDSAENQRKLTPAERARAKRDEARQRELASGPPVAGVVDQNVGNVRPPMGVTAGGRA